MRAVERLKRDHQVLRAKLQLLESALGLEPESWFVLRELCYSLSAQLADHIRREEELLAACRCALSSETAAGIELAHRDEPAHLRAINQLFLSGSEPMIVRIRPRLHAAITGLRRHMEDEERALFPVLEQRCSGVEWAPGGIVVWQPVELSAEMTVNHIVRRHPQTRTAFERLFISSGMEGSDCLDEVAWRHGLSCDQLIRLLETAIAADASTALAS